MNITRFNLNLLKALDALLSTRNVSLAAERLHITQPAMSNALRQLREVFQDDLLIRRHKMMVPTAKALAIAEEVHQTLMRLQELTAKPGQFNPLESTREFIIGMNDYIEFVLLHHLIKQIVKQGPNIKVTIVPINTIDIIEPYEQQRIELGLGIVRHANLAAQLHYQNLFTDQPICILRKNHPLLKKKKYLRLNLKDYLAGEHLSIEILESRKLSLTDQALAELNLKRNTKVRLQHILSGLNTLRNSDLIGTLPMQIGLTAKNDFRLELVPVPFKIPHVTITQVWHSAQNHDPGHQWLRQQIKIISEKIKAT